MVDLFHFIEHNFAVPAETDSVDVKNESAFQNDLEEAAGSEIPGERVRALALQFLTTHFVTPTSDPAAFGRPLNDLAGALRSLLQVNSATVRRVVREVLGQTPAELVVAAPFIADRELLQNAVLAAKLVTGFDRVDVTRLVRQLRAVAFVRTIAATPESAKLSRLVVDRLLGRPVRIPSALLAAATRQAPPQQPQPRGPSEEQMHIRARRRERDRLQSAYGALLAARPADFELYGAQEVREHAEDPYRIPRDNEAPVFETNQIAGRTPVLRLTASARERILSEHAETFGNLRLDLAETSVETAMETVGRSLAKANDEVLPHEVATSATVFRVGGHLFAETGPLMALEGEAPEVDAPMPDFSAAITRPLGYGNLQVVRQQLIGYRPTEISHIENVLEGELLRRETERTEVSELILIEETTTTRSQERDNQSTNRNELSSETQKEAEKRSSTSGDGMTSSDYGRLVENSKSNFAQTVVARSVESLTQQVRQQRTQRESKTYVERASHQFDNSRGENKIRGIYQWVNKVYSLRVLNYGKRLMYDVVVPEPAAFLIQSLKKAVQPETFHLTKPIEPNLSPSWLNEGNYMWFAAKYGVTGAVSPPPQIYARTVAHASAVRSGTEHIKAYGVELDTHYQVAFKLIVPEGYRAVRGYVQHVNQNHLGDAPGAVIEALVGESARLRTMSAETPFLRASFTMSGETGEVPVTLRTFARVVSLSYAVALVCQRTDSAFEQWQLKTHATIVSGYQRQLAAYEDKLARYVAAVRTQMALAGNYAHNPTVVLEELKRAFIFLLLGEHTATWPQTPAPAPMPAPVPGGITFPDPNQVKKWGAVVAFFERAFEWENLMFNGYPYYWARAHRWEELLLVQDADPRFESFLKAGAARVVVPVRPGFEAALAHYQETGNVWMGEEIPDMFGEHYLSIIEEIKAANSAPGTEVCVEQWEVTLPTTLVILKEDATLPSWTPAPCKPET